MRNLSHLQHLHFICRPLIRGLPRFRPPSHKVGPSAFPLKTERYLYCSKFTRSQHANALNSSTENEYRTGLPEQYDGETQATSNEQLPSLEETELNGEPENQTASLDCYLSPALQKIVLHIHATCPNLVPIYDKPSLFFERLAKTEILHFKETMTAVDEKQFVCDVNCHIKDRDISISAVGKGSSKKNASQIAYSILITELHSRNALIPLIETASGETYIDRKMLPKKLTQLSDVYNYAASFGSTPKTTIRQFTTINHLNKIRTLVEFTIELSQQNIKAAAISEAFVSSLAGAVARFEQQVNDNEFTKSTVNGVTTLTSKNARHFLEQHHKNTSFELDAVHVCPGPRTISYFRAVLLANGKEIAHPVLAKSRTEAVSLAYLAAAVTLRANERSLESGPSEPLKGSGRSALPPVLPTSTTLEEDCLLAMQGTIQEMRETGFPDDANQYQPDMVPLEERRRTRRYELTEERAHSQSRRLRWMLRMFRRDPRLKDLRDKLSALPMNRYRTQVINMVEKNNYSVIIGATGSGKTTQVPQILLNHAVREGRGAHCNIICTQPRRIAASSVARRVAEERDQQLRDSVGYHIRFDPQLPRAGGSITYCTTGILLVQLQHAPDEIFDSVSHIIVDEIHERDVDVDFLLILLKNVVKRRKRENKSVPKIILMSATIDPDLFADYFPNELPDGTLARCPSLSIPGRTFPVKHWYLEDLVQQFSTAYDAEEILPLLEEKDTAAYLDDLEAKHEPQAEDSKATRQSSGWDNVHDSSIDSQEATSRVQDDEPLVPLGLTCATIGHIARTSPEGAILVFLPGLGEIQRVQQMLMEQSPLGVDFSDSNKYRIFKLHSRIAATEKDVFASLPAGCRKIILSTNIAETSVTISDVQYVVDTGKLREKRYDQERRISKLACCWISKSNAKQRSGRAGRVQNGNYYALYTRQQFESFRAVGVPEMLRSDLQEICLRVKAQAFQTRIRDFLAQALEPPSLTQVDSTVTNLQTLEALDQNEEITALGRLLAQLPVHPSQGKMIVLGIIFRCLDPMIIMSSIGSEGLLWNLGIGEERAAAAKSRAEYVYESNSEHIGIINAFKDARNVLRTAGNDACRAHCEPRYVHFQSFRNILRTTRQIKDILEEKNLIPVDLSDGVELGGPDLNVNSSRIPLIKALLTSGMFPNIAVSTNRKGAFRTENEINAYLHFRNTLSAQSTTGKAPQGRRLIAFSSLEKAMQGDMLLLRDVQEITPLVAMLFGGRLTGKDDTVTMDSWLPFHIPHPGTSTHVPYQPAKMVIEFRKALDRVLTLAFKDLSKFSYSRIARQRKRLPGYLADDPARIMFAERFVEVLLLDIQPK